MPYCQHCGKDVVYDAEICPHCGRRIKKKEDQDACGCLSAFGGIMAFFGIAGLYGLYTGSYAPEGAYWVYIALIILGGLFIARAWGKI